MLVEAFFTPKAFTSILEDDDELLVQDLQDILLPKRHVSIVLLCQLGVAWREIVAKRITQIKNQDRRLDAMKFFSKLEDNRRLAKRPSVDQPQPNSTNWLKAAHQSSNSVPIDYFISEGETTRQAEALDVKDFLSERFNEELANPSVIDRSTSAQKKRLKTLCAQAEWIVIRLPRVSGGNDDEIVTVKQIIQLSTCLPVGFSKTDIDLHICGQNAIGNEKLGNAVRSELQPLLEEGFDMRISVWPEKSILNREIIAGVYTQTSGGIQKQIPLWWLTMSHVAVGNRKGTSASEGANTWSLFSREKANSRFHELQLAQKEWQTACRK